MSNKLGIVLSGGGSRGAYEVGVLKYIAERGMEPNVYSGASIGAINAAILASAKSFIEGVIILETIWRNLTTAKVASIDYEAMLAGFMFEIFKIYSGSSAMKNSILIADFFKRRKNVLVFLSALSGLEPYFYKKNILNKSIITVENLKDLLYEALDFDNLKTGKPLWISLYPSRGKWIDISEYLIAEFTRITDTRDSEYINLQSIKSTEQVNALLASAAIPFFLPAQYVEGKKYSDGGLGGTKKSLGNTPIIPLINCGCDTCIVIHASDGSLWDRTDFPNTTIIEIRPDKFLQSEGKLNSMTNFSPSKLFELIEQGYMDAKRCIGTIITAGKIIQENNKGKERLLKLCQTLENDKFDEAINSLEKKRL